MSRARFHAILNSLAFCHEHPPLGPDDDPWIEISSFIDEFNENRAEGFEPGSHMVVDKIMSAWTGAELKYQHGGAPHVTKIPRKLEGVGMELKAVADGETGIIMRVESMKGAETQREEPSNSDRTVATLRLLEPWFESNRVVHADSAFSSVLTARQLKKRGLYFMGIVKTAHNQFPKKYLHAQALKYGKSNPRGGHMILESVKGPNGIEEEPIYALALYDKRTKCIVSTCGSTALGLPSCRKKNEFRAIDTYNKEVQRPQMIEEFFSCFSKINVHDNYRKRILQIEKSWITQKWYHRLFATLLGVSITDAFLAYKYDCLRGNKSEPDYVDFCYDLAHELLQKNHHRTEGLPTSDETSSESEQKCSLTHSIANLREHKIYSGSKSTDIRLACTLCKERKTSFYCLGCSDSRPVALCAGKDGRDCFGEYHQKLENI